MHERGGRGGGNGSGGNGGRHRGRERKRSGTKVGREGAKRTRRGRGGEGERGERKGTSDSSAQEERERKILFLVSRLPAKIGGPWNLIISTSVGNSGLFMSVLCSTAARLSLSLSLGSRTLEGKKGISRMEREKKKKIRVEEEWKAATSKRSRLIVSNDG